MKITVEQIHNDFDNAQELILEQAKKIINENKVTNADYVSKMKELGFVNSESVKQAEKKQTASIKSKEMAERVMYYKRQYPFLKFLTEDKLDEICDKYGLIYAPVVRYKKDVPKKNLEEISSVQKLSDKDAYDVFYVMERANRDFNTQNTKENIDRVKSFKFQNNPTSDKYSAIREFENKDDINFLYLDDCTFTEFNQSGLFIGAPKSHFNTKGLSSHKKGFFNTSIVKKEVKDPIVFRYVKGGIQVLSKWGDEAEDAELVNEILN